MPCLHGHLANPARARYPAVLLNSNFPATSGCCGDSAAVSCPSAVAVLFLHGVWMFCQSGSCFCQLCFFLKVSYASSCCILRSLFFHIFRLHDYFVSVHLIPHILILVFLPSFSLHSAMLFQFPYPDGLGRQQGPSPRSCTLHSCIRCLYQMSIIAWEKLPGFKNAAVLIRKFLQSIL